MHLSENQTTAYFRFLGLSKMQAFTLRREVMDASFDESSLNEFVGYVPLTEPTIHEINDFFVRQMIKVEACDIMVVANVEGAESLIRVPKVVNQMLKYIDCDLVYSFGDLGFAPE